MCDLSMVLTLGSTIIGAVGQVQQANAASAAAEYNAQVAEMNAEISEKRAKSVIEAGANEEQMKRQEVQRILGQQQAGLAANGVDLTFGSPLDTIVDTAVLGELDALTIRTNTYREAYNSRVDAVNQRAGAELHRYEAKTTKQGGYLAAMGTILGGAGQAYQQWSQPRTGSTVGAYA